MELYKALVLEAMWEVWCDGYATVIRGILENNGTRGRWLAMVTKELNLDQSLLWEPK